MLTDGAVGHGGVGSTRDDIEQEVRADGLDGRCGGEGERINTVLDVGCEEWREQMKGEAGEALNRSL